MNNFKKAFLGSALVFSLLFTGCGDDSSSSSIPTESINGKVIDGYWIGAIVCVDRDSSGTCDDGEPNATSGLNGDYNITEALTSDIGTYPLVAEGIKDTTFDQGSEGIQAGYLTQDLTFTTPKEIQNQIDPYTTLVQAEIKNNNKSFDDAKNSVASLKNIPADAIGKDYIADGNTTLQYKAVDIATLLKENNNSASQALTELENESNGTTIGTQIVHNYPSNTSLSLDGAPLAADEIKKLIQSAEHNITIEMYYVSNEANSTLDQNIIQPLIKKAKDGINVRILLSEGGPSDADDVNDLNNTENITVNYSGWFDKDDGIIHAKVITVDNARGYIGSHNFDWITFSLNHELGVVYNNELIANQMASVFEFDWYNATHNEDSTITYAEPANSGSYQLGVSPELTPPGNLAWDNTKLIALMNNATTEISMQSMTIDYYDYYMQEYWTEFRDAIINAAKRGVKVRMMMSDWEFQYADSNGSDDSNVFLQGLLDPANDWSKNIEIRISSYPSQVPCVPYSEVDHGKYMIIDNNVWISTANLGKNYFYGTRDYSFYGLEDDNMSTQLRNIFDTMWDSDYMTKYLFHAPWTQRKSTSCKNYYIETDIHLRVSSNVDDEITNFNNYISGLGIYTQYGIEPFLENHPTHVTLYLTSFLAENQDKILNYVKNYAASHSAFDFNLTNYVSGEFVMLEVQNNTDLQNMSDDIITNLSPYRDTSYPMPSWVNNNSGKKESFQKYGTPNAFNEFAPHVSIFATPYLDTTEQATLDTQMNSAIGTYQMIQNSGTTVELCVGQTDQRGLGQIVEEYGCYPLQ